jgi:two-component system, NtrC family, response regulator HydG
VPYDSSMPDHSTEDVQRFDAHRVVQRPRWAMLVVHSDDEPERVGEVLLTGSDVGTTATWGRGDGAADDVRPRLVAYRQRPGRSEPMPAFRSKSLSRVQLEVTPTARGLHVKNVGRLCLDAPDRRSEVELAEGDVIVLGEGTIVLACVRRPAVWPGASRSGTAFGAPDTFGFVGESPLAWKLREDLEFVARRRPHVLVLGPSGSGKELAARAIAADARPFVSRNATTMPESLLDAELFGNVRDYPNPGMRERAGLVGAADGGVLFLDEIGELSEDAQAHLLRVLDDGEYHRLGEDRPRRARLRLICATNRDESELKHDFLARLLLRVRMPDLNERREDVPLLVRHLLGQAIRGDDELRKRFAEGAFVRVDGRLVAALWRHRYSWNVRELLELCWLALRTSVGDRVGLTDEVAAKLDCPADDGARREATADEIRAALADSGGVLERAWRSLGLPNRHVLARLMKKHGIR